MRGRPLVFASIGAAAVVAALVVLFYPQIRDEPEVTTFLVGDAPSQLVYDEDGRLWVVESGAQRISTIQTGSLETRSVATLQEIPGQIAVGPFGAVVAPLEAPELTFLRGDDLAVEVRDVPGLGPAQTLTYSEGELWVASLEEPAIARFDPATGEVLQRLPKFAEFPSAVLRAHGSLWVADVVSDVVWKVDPDDPEERTRIEVGRSPTLLAAGGGRVWVANFTDRSVVSIDPESYAVGHPSPVGARPGGLAAGLGYLWVTSSNQDALLKIDLSSGRLSKDAVLVGEDPAGVVVAEGYVWVANQGDDSVSRIEP